MAKQFKNRKKIPDTDPVGKDRGPNTGAWEKITSGFRGAAKYAQSWNSGYDGSGKGTW